MSAVLGPVPKTQFNQNGVPLAGGKLFTYAAGTTTKQTTYTNVGAGTPNANPIILDSNGQCDIFLTPNLLYKYTLSPSTDTDPPTNPFWTEDNISGMLSANSIPGNNFSAYNTYNATNTIPSSYAGTIVVYTGSTSSQTITLPLSTGVNAGSTLVFQNDATVSVTIGVQGSDKIQYGQATQVTSVVVKAGDSLYFVATSGFWVAWGGSAYAVYSPLFKGSLLTNGYQELPGGYIRQWGTVTVANGSETTVNWPLAFPNAPLNAQLTVITSAATNTSTLSVAIVASSFSTTIMNVYDNSTTGGTKNAYWEAIGW